MMAWWADLVGRPTDDAKVWEDDAQRVVDAVRREVGQRGIEAVHMDCVNTEDRDQIRRRVNIKLTHEEQKLVLYTTRFT